MFGKIICFILGSIVGVVVTSLCVVAGTADERMGLK